jgi:hypothetical protein
MLITVKLYGKLWQRISFNPTMRFGLMFFLLIGLTGRAFAQEDTIRGIVFDKVTKDRVALVNVLNTRTKIAIYDNLKGVFAMDAKIGDVLIFTKQFYTSDTIKVTDYNSLAVYMKPMGNMLKQVNIRDTILTPEQQLAKTKQEYNKIYGPLGEKDAISVGPDGAGLSIDALYDAISRSGRQAAHLRENIQEDYHQSVIDYRFNRKLVASITGLKDKQLTDFMQKYRPGYFFVTNATDYEFIASIKANYRRYSRRPNAFAIPRLPSVPPPATLNTDPIQTSPKTKVQ